MSRLDTCFRFTAALCPALIGAAGAVAEADRSKKCGGQVQCMKNPRTEIELAVDAVYAHIRRASLLIVNKSCAPSGTGNTSRELLILGTAPFLAKVYSLCPLCEFGKLWCGALFLRRLVLHCSLLWCSSTSLGGVDDLLKGERPIIQEMLFSSEKPPIHDGGTNREPSRWYLARWESPHRFFVAEALTLDDVSRTDGNYPASMRWYCADKDRWWYLERLGQKFIAHVWNTSTPQEGCCNGVFKTVEDIRRTELDTVIGAGISYASNAKVTWTDDTYQFTNEWEKVSASGLFKRDESGRAKSALHTFEKEIVANGKPERKVFRHRVEYEYEKEAASVLPDGFPSVINLFALREPLLPFFIKRVRIQSLTLSKEPLLAHHLGFESIVNSSKGMALLVYYTSNRTEYAFNGKAWMPLLSPDARILASEKRGSKGTRTVLLVVMLLTSGTFVTVWLTRTRSNATE